MTRRWVSFALVFVLVLSMLSGLCAITYAQAAEQENSIRVLLDGAPIGFDVEPQLIHERTMVPLRAIFEALGATVYWEDETQTVTAVKGDVLVQLTVGSENMYCCGRQIVLDSPACLIEDRTLVPVRAISEAFGMLVDWDGETSTVLICTPTSPTEEKPAADIFEVAHRKLRALIMEAQQWDEENKGYWEGYTALAPDDEPNMFLTTCDAMGVHLSFVMEREYYKIVCMISMNEYNYPTYVLQFVSGEDDYSISGVFGGENALPTNLTNTFLPDEKASADVIRNGCFGFIDAFMQSAFDMTLGDCGIRYENPML